MMRTARAGFTLIEVIVGMAIVVMLATVVTPVMIGAIDRARIDAGAQALSRVAEAIDGFEDDVDTWPGTLMQLTQPIQTSDADLCGRTYPNGWTGRWNGPYLDRMVTSSGLQVGVGTAPNTLVQVNVGSGGSAMGLLRVLVTGVLEGDAVALDRRFDASPSSSEGTIVWGAADGQGRVTMAYVVPTRRC